jgi:hypothetical protein
MLLLDQRTGIYNHCIELFMKGRRGTLLSRSGKYDLLLLALIVFAALLVIGVWAWYGQKNEQLEREIYLLR